MSWRDRLQATINFISPEGNIFSALWTGNPREIEKKLGIFNFPRIAGSVVQDLEVNATTYPLTIFFEGIDHDLIGEDFFRACGEKGIWSINHPVKGELNLQLVLCSENIAPIEFGNITQFTTEWIEPLQEIIEVTPVQLKASALNQIDNLNSVTSEQFNNIVTVDMFSKISALEKTTQDIVSAVDVTLKPIYELNDTIASQILSIKNGIDLFFIGTINVLSLAGQIQQLIQLPSLVKTDIKAKINAYINFANSILNILPEESSKENLNIIAIKELALTSYFAASVFIAATGILQSRVESIEIIDQITDAFNDSINSLDATQELYENVNIDIQYFSQSESFNESTKITATALSYLIKNIFDLVIEKKIILKKMRTPLEITITEYGSLGNSDENFELFVSSNKLKNNDILILPSGREVLVYV